MELITGGSVTSPAGFSASAVVCGLKKNKNLDLALVVSDRDCTAAGVFTRNRVAAAPVLLDKETLAVNSSRIRIVAANAGNANACTGGPGMAAAREMQKLAAEAIGCAPGQALVLSTGVIGVQLPVDKVRAGITVAAAGLSPEGGDRAAHAIMTTDTRPKQIAVSLETANGTITLAGMAKGSGMIHPDMATMLSVITTDAAVPAGLLYDLLLKAVDLSFNRISVDGDTSTNDTVLLLANGAGGAGLDDPDSIAAFDRALTFVCVELAKMIVRDGEGASRFVELTVTGAATEADAFAVARTIATSPLVKTAFAGGDPNWGRILAAAGRAGVPLEQEKLALWITGEKTLQLVQGGTPLDYAESDAAAIFALPECQVHVDLGMGGEQAVMWTCDLTHDYVTINADYRT